jgi:DMSO/TMAO reductase YedYZ molybdopterin-dependent catalytic subunit
MRRALGAVSGLVAALVALGVAELVSAFVDAKASPVVAVGASVIDATPQWLKQRAIEQFGTNDKPVLIGTIVAVLLLLSLVTGLLAVRRPVVGLAGVGALGVVGALAAETRPTAVPLASLPSVVGAAVGALALVLLLRPLRGSRRTSMRARDDRSWRERLSDHLRATDRGSGGLDRRAFLVTGLGAVAVAGASGAIGRVAIGRRFDASESRAAVALPRPESPATPVPAGAELRLPDLSPFTTPNDDFYRVDIALVVPQVTTDEWRLRVHGMVDREIELDFDQLLQRGLVERDITLTCVSNEVGGRYAGNARWLGAPLGDLLREAGPHRDADQLLSRSVDGMTIGTPTAVVLDGRDALLAVGMNGEPLPAEHGFPVRMVVPGLYGYVSATKWVVDLELTTFADAKPYWVERGWVPQAPVKTMSRIDTPRPLSTVKAGRVAVAGVAWAQHRGIAKVEVRVDEGAWRPARLAAVPSTDTWRQWVYEWDAEPGHHSLEVRATDAQSHLQQQRRAKPFPSGATGWHTTTVTVA